MNRVNRVNTKITKILVLDEDATRRNNFTSRLRLQEFDTEIGTGGFHALHLLEKENYHVIVIFDDMHDMPGEEIVGLMRSHFAKEKLPILFISKKPDPVAADELFKLGIDDYLPYSPQFFAQVLEKIKLVTSSGK